MNRSEIQQILFGLYPAAQRLVILPTFRDSRPIRSRVIVVLTFVGGQFHVVKLALNFNRTELVLMVSSLSLL